MVLVRIASIIRPPDSTSVHRAMMSLIADSSKANPIRWFCSLRYLVMAESYWFEFMSCVGFSGYVK